MTLRRHSAHTLRRVGLAALAVAGSLLALGACWPGPADAAAPGEPAGVAAPARAVNGSVSGLRPLPEPVAPHVAPAGRLRQADVLVVSAGTLPQAANAAVARLRGVTATELADAARITVDGRAVAVLGVRPSSFRRFAARPTALDTPFWQGVADGAIGVSDAMAHQDRLPIGQRVPVVGRRRVSMAVGGIGAVGIAGVDAVILDSAARSLGFPVANALLISADPARIASVVARVKARMPGSALVEQLAPARSGGGQAGPGATAGAASLGGLLTAAQARAMLEAAVSRLGTPYVWGAAGPASFDCSGLVQWSFARAGIVMPRVAADQARAGPAVRISQLQPGDLLFYHTDPTAPGYISHVAIYLGRGEMIQAPQPGMNVEVVPLALGSQFAGAIKVSPRLAAQVAASPVG